MKAYVLGVPGAFRGTELVRQLSDFGLEVEIVWGIDARTLSSTQLAELYAEESAKVTCGRSLTKGEVACAWGHAEIARRVAASGADWALAFEDDAELTNLNIFRFNELGSLPPRSIIVLFHDVAGNMYVRPAQRRRQGLRRLAVPPRFAAAYCIGRTAALESVRHDSLHRRIDCTADWPVCWAPRVKFWCLADPMAVHPGSTSLLEKDRAAASRELIFPSRLSRVKALHGIGVDWITAARGVLLQPAVRFLLRRAFGTRYDIAVHRQKDLNSLRRN